MKVVLSRKSMLRLIDRCLPATSDGVVGHGKSILLTAEQTPDQLRGSAVGMTLSIDTCVAAKVSEPGATAIEAPALRSFVEALPDGDITVATTEKRVKVSAGSRRFSMAIFDPRFPAVPEMPERDAQYLLLSAPLQKILSAIGYAMDEAVGHEHMHGVMVQLAKDKLSGVALCGYGAAQLKVEQGAGTVMAHSGDGETELFFPAVMHKSIGMLCAETINLRVDRTDNHLFVESEDTLLVGALPNQPYPDWRSILSHCDTPPICSLDGPTLLASVRAMLTAAPQSAVCLELKPPVLRLRLPETADEEGVDELPVTADAAGSFRTLIGASMLADALAVGGVVTLACAGELDPFIIRSADGAYKGFLMPMRPIVMAKEEETP